MAIVEFGITDVPLKYIRRTKEVRIMTYKYKAKTQVPVRCEKCQKEFVVLRDSGHKKVPVLFDSLDEYEKSFITQAGDVEYDRTRHKKHGC